MAGSRNLESPEILNNASTDRRYNDRHNNTKNNTNKDKKDSVYLGSTPT